jgi:hypothetical protein
MLKAYRDKICPSNDDAESIGFHIFDLILRGCEIVDRKPENVAKLADFTSDTKNKQGYNKTKAK